jgi:hypothetical protein
MFDVSSRTRYISYAGSELTDNERAVVPPG